MKKLISIFLSLYKHVYCRINPVGYARSIGVKVGNSVRFYHPNPGMFSTEPWLITIGNNVHITSGVQFLTHDGGTVILKKEIDNFILTGPINIEDDVYIGLRTVILPGVKIGKRCIIGACSLVSSDIPDNSVACGSPARAIKNVDGYVDKLKSVIAGEIPRYCHSFEHLSALKKERMN